MSGAPRKPARKPPPCPICGRPPEAGMEPFCSVRCADVDLGRWLGGGYVIPGDDNTGTDLPEPKDERD